MNRPPRLGGNRGWLRALGIAGLCYLSGLVVLNLASTPQGDLLNRIFPHWGPSSSLDLRSLNSAWSQVEREYVVRGIPGGAGTEGAERGIVDKLKATSAYHDRFSAFLTREEAAALDADLGGQRNGSVGIALLARCAGAARCAAGESPTLVLIGSVLRGQPADRAGVRNGDVLVAVDGAQVRTPLSTGRSLDQQVGRIRGPAGTTVRLTVHRGARELVIPVQRADLRIPSVYSQAFGQVLYVQVTSFNSDTALAARTQLQAGLARGATSVILDLRHNGGGYVAAARSLASEFVAPGPGRQDVVVRRGRMESVDRPDTAEQVFHDTIETGGVATRVRLVMLVDGDSASASEIVAAALRDYGRATLVGERTLGKGSVQRDFTLPDGSDLHLTVEKWYGPDGESIDERGVDPQRTVALADEADRFELDAQSADASQDSQLQAALAAASSR